MDESLPLFDDSDEEDEESNPRRGRLTFEIFSHHGSHNFYIPTETSTTSSGSTNLTTAATTASSFLQREPLVEVEFEEAEDGEDEDNEEPAGDDEMIDEEGPFFLGEEQEEEEGAEQEEDEDDNSSTLSMSSLKHSEADAVDAVELNLTELDNLVLQYLCHEGILHSASTTSVTSKSAAVSATFGVSEYQPLLHQIRKFVGEGNTSEVWKMLTCTTVDGGTTTLQQVLPDTLLFKLHLQHVIELLRNVKNNVQKQMEAIQYCKQYITPLAQSVYPKAFTDFQTTLMALLLQPGCKFDTSKSCSAIVQLMDDIWSLERRDKLAFEFHYHLTKALGIQESKFSLLMRYLVTVHNLYHFLSGEGTRYPDIEKLFLSETREPQQYGASTPLSPLVREKDVQTLIQLLSISRQEAKKALLAHNGSVRDALKAELCRLKLNNELLVEICVQYSSSRGLLYNHSLNSSKLNYSNASKEALEKSSNIRHLREEANNHNFEKVINMVEAIEPHYFDKHFLPLFQLYQKQFLVHIQSNNQQQALQVATKHLAPLSQKHPDLLDSFKDTILLLAFCNNSTPECTTFVKESIAKLEQKLHIDDIISPICVTLSASLGLLDVKLMQILKYLFLTYHQWTSKHSSCESFEDYFEMDKLRKQVLLPSIHVTRNASPPSTITINPLSSINTNTHTTTSSTIPPLSTLISRPGRVRIRGPRSNTGEPSEFAIRTLMEITQVTRERALELLNRHNNDVNEAIDSMFE